jgi:hypothetical protein
MKLEKLSAFAEITSSVAIVITLAYLAVQTQQTNRALFANSREATMVADVSFLLAQADHPEMNMPRAGVAFDPREQAIFESLTIAFFRIREFAFFQHAQGIMDDDAFESYMAVTIRRVRNEQVAQLWDQFSSELDPGFVAYVNERI